MAHEMGMQVADKKDSQEICFVAAGEHAEFIRRRAGRRRSRRRNCYHRWHRRRAHEGFESFTIGQRKGLGVAFGEPRYVVRLDAETRRVVIGSREDLARRSFTASGTNWLVDPPTEPTQCLVQIRYNSRPAAAVVEPLADGRLTVSLAEPLGGIAPGQAVVCYDGDRVLGGGWID